MLLKTARRLSTSICRPVLPQEQTSLLRAGTSASVESRMGAVAWAMRQRSVSHPRSSNRTCRSPASGSPTGFTARHTTGQLGAGVRDAADRVLHRQLRKRIGEYRVLPSCVVYRRKIIDQVVWERVNCSVSDVATPLPDTDRVAIG